MEQKSEVLMKYWDRALKLVKDFLEEPGLDGEEKMCFLGRLL